MRERILKKLLKNDQRGATAVEFAVVAAILFFILFGILEFGLIFMQEHFIANAAREGVRIGVRANNYNCLSTDETTGCPTTGRVYRVTVVDQNVREYLASLYDSADTTKVIVNIESTPTPAPPATPTKKTLSVRVTAPNFFPPIISSLAALIPGTDFELPETISYTVEGEYEDPSEP
jgi:Flp pilus assembly protein TadG